MSEDTCSAAKGGYLELLKWLKSNGCGWTEDCCYFVVLRGHLEVLIWARHNGCKWSAWTCYAAAKGDHLEVLK